MSRKNNDGFCGNKNKNKNNDDCGGNIWSRPSISHIPLCDQAKPTIMTEYQEQVYEVRSLKCSSHNVIFVSGAISS